MTFVDAVKVCFNKYAEFSGRARRSEFWFFYLFTVLVSFGFSILTAFDVVSGLPLFTVLGGLASLGLILPSISVTIRRLHDTGKSGWHFVFWYILPWVLFIPLVIASVVGAMFAGDSMTSAIAAVSGVGIAALLPLAGAIVMFVFLVSDSKPEENKYGPSPKL